MNHFDQISSLNNELINLQRELAKKNAELVSLNALKNQFLGMAAHDLRNPLYVVSTYAGFLADDAQSLGESKAEMVKNISDMAGFMAALVDDLLDVSRIEAGQLTTDLAFENFLLLLLHESVKLNQLIASKKSINIELHTADQEILLS